MKIKLNSDQRASAFITKSEVKLLNEFFDIEQPIQLTALKVSQFRTIRDCLRSDLVMYEQVGENDGFTLNLTARVLNNLEPFCPELRKFCAGISDYRVDDSV